MKKFAWQDMFVCLAAGIFIGVGLFDALPYSAAMFGLWETIILAAVGVGLWWLIKLLVQAMKQPDMPPLVVAALWLHSATEGFVTGIAFGVSRAVGLTVLVGMILHLLPEFFAAVTLMKGAGAKNRSSIIVTFIGYAVFFVAFYLTYASLFSMRLFMPTFIAVSGGVFIYVGLRSFWPRRSLQAIVPVMLGALIAFLVR